jgi:3-oxoacyl-[acyl-carrier protein] reductase
MDLGLAGKRALVTGGSRGIGRAIVLDLARSGASVAAVFQRPSEAVESLSAELKTIGGDSYTAQADVSDEASVTALVSGVRERYGRIDTLVNNAGVVSHRTLADLDLAEWRRIIDVNLTSMFLVTKAVVPAMPSGGSIINLTSAVAERGMVGRTHYTASKTGIIGFTRSLCKEMGPKGIRANAVAPGIIETDQAAGLTPEGRARYAGLAALGRLGKSEDISGVVLFFASDLSQFVSGVTINVDGGI